MSSKLDASTGLTCISCRVVFADGDIQREHYRSEWHRYNLKRKVAELPPVTCEQFEQKAVSFKDKTTDKVAVVTKPSFCAVCNKNFQSSNAYDNHLNSKKHKENDAKPRRDPVYKLAEPKLKIKETVKAEDTPMEEIPEQGDSVMDEDDDSEGWVTDNGTDDEDDFDESNGIPVTTCLFCSNPSGSVTENVDHMGRLHGFFLPDAEYCIDAEAMLRYLGLKVGSGNMCLWCSESRRFRSLDACQKHMRDKAHCRVAHEGNAMLEFDDFYDYSSMYPEEEEDDSSNVLVQDGYSLILPSGARVGHRSLMRYYRQNLKPENALVKSTKSKEALNNLISQYRAIGWTATTGPLALQRAKDMRFMRRLKSQQWLKIGMGSNKLFKTRGRKDQLS